MTTCSGTSKRRTRVFAIVTMAALSVVSVASTTQGRESKKRRVVKKPPKYAVIGNPGTWGSLKGTCSFSHAMPIRTATIGGCPAYLETENTPTRFDPKNLGAPGCMISIERISKGNPWPATMANTKSRVKIDMDKYEFKPRIQWTRRGKRIGFRLLAWDTTKHKSEVSVHGYFNSLATTAWNISLPFSKDHFSTTDTKLSRVGIYITRCDICSTVPSYIQCSPHPYVSGPTPISGSYAISDIPPGTYSVTCWHEPLRWKVKVGKYGRKCVVDDGVQMLLRKKVVIKPGKATTLNWTLEVPSDLRTTKSAK